MAHTPENATLRARITIEGEPRLLFYVPSSKEGERPYLFACDEDGGRPSCECEFRHPRRTKPCPLYARAAEVAARKDILWEPPYPYSKS